MKYLLIAILYIHFGATVEHPSNGNFGGDTATSMLTTPSFLVQIGSMRAQIKGVGG